MKNIKRAGKLLSLALLFLCFMMPWRLAYALEEYDKLWVSYVTVKPFSEDSKWLYLFYTSTRFIDQSHPWQMTLLEGGVGRYVLPGHALWAGYRWSAHNPNNGFFQINTLFQQWIYEMRDDSNFKVLLRTRFQEMLRSDASPVAILLRERLYFLSPKKYFNRISPVYYDEAFLQLNQTKFTSSSFISENRLFLGFNFFIHDKEFWEIGYMNQYQFSTPLIKQNQMSHVLSFTYIII